jgi:small subunit ribosomal protein S16
MLRIRLKRIGKNPKGRPFFRVVVLDRKKARDSRPVEEIGYYDPTKEPTLVQINKKRFNYWLSRGAQPSETVNSLIKKVT